MEDAEVIAAIERSFSGFEPGDRTSALSMQSPLEAAVTATPCSRAHRGGIPTSTTWERRARSSSGCAVCPTTAGVTRSVRSSVAHIHQQVPLTTTHHIGAISGLLERPDAAQTRMVSSGR
jgi:hypothetical protein